MTDILRLNAIRPEHRSILSHARPVMAQSVIAVKCQLKTEIRLARVPPDISLADLTNIFRLRYGMRSLQLTYHFDDDEITFSTDDELHEHLDRVKNLPHPTVKFHARVSSAPLDNENFVSSSYVGSICSQSTISSIPIHACQHQLIPFNSVKSVQKLAIFLEKLAPGICGKARLIPHKLCRIYEKLARKVYASVHSETYARVLCAVSHRVRTILDVPTSAHGMGQAPRARQMDSAARVLATELRNQIHTDEAMCGAIVTVFRQMVEDTTVIRVISHVSKVRRLPWEPDERSSKRPEQVDGAQARCGRCNRNVCGEVLYVHRNDRNKCLCIDCYSSMSEPARGSYEAIQLLDNEEMEGQIPRARLARGMHGEQVRLLYQRLNELGFVSRQMFMPWREDKFSRQLYGAVVKYQSERRLTGYICGVYDEVTEEALRKDVARMAGYSSRATSKARSRRSRR